MSLLQNCIVICPWCGEVIELVVDSSISVQEYIEDCSVCCQPINVYAVVDEAGEVDLRVTTDRE
jgi:hypothetical protein